MSHSPMSLQQICLLYIILHLEHLPVQMLSLLPVQIRQELLTKLAVADICALEKTSFVKGLDMKAIWKTICIKRLPLETEIIFQRNVFIKELNINEGSKEYFLTLMAHLALKTHVDQPVSFILCLLLGIPDKFPRNKGHYVHESIQGVDGVSVFPESLVVPKRYVADCPPTKGYSPSIHPLMVLADRIGFCPRLLCFEPLEYFNLVGIETVTCLRKFLSKIETMSFHMLNRINYYIISCIVKTVLSNTSPTLTFLHAVSYSMAGPGVDTILLSIPPSPCTVLKKLVVTVNHCDPAQSEPLRRLATLIDNSRATLESLNLMVSDKWVSETSTKGSSTKGLKPICHQLACALSEIAGQPQMRETLINNIHISSTHLLQLIHSFLISPSPCEQSLSLSELVVSKTTSQSFLGNTTVTSTSTVPASSCKSLSVTGMHMSNELVSQITSYHQLHLKRLCLNQVSSDKRLVTELCQNPHLFSAEKVDLESCSTICSLGDITMLLSQNRLKSLTVCDFAIETILGDLTQGLVNQVLMTGSLQELAIVSCSLGLANDSNLWLFFIALFNLPQLQTLSLDLRYNKLQSHHLTMMHKAWCQVASQPLRSLCLDASECTGDMETIMNEIAQHLKRQ